MTSAKRILFGALARSWIREVELEITDTLTDFFVDICLGIGVDEEDEVASAELAPAPETVAEGSAPEAPAPSAE